MERKNGPKFDVIGTKNSELIHTTGLEQSITNRKKVYRKSLYYLYGY